MQGRSNRVGNMLNSMNLSSDQMMKSPNYEPVSKFSGGIENSPDVRTFKSMSINYDTNLKLKMVRVQENDSDSDSEDSEEER